jgi:hypothetical protein
LECDEVGEREIKEEDSFLVQGRYFWRNAIFSLLDNFTKKLSSSLLGRMM